MPRVFIAVNIPPRPKVLALLNELRGLGRAIRPVDPENLHLTLRFLGDTAPELMPRLTQIVRAAVGDMRGFDLQLAGMGVFPDLSRPTVIWVGTRGDEPLAALSHRLTVGLSELGVAPEERHPGAWVCHLTVARVKARPPGELRGVLDKYGRDGLGVVRVQSVEVMCSELLPNGPQYTIAASVPLGG